MFLDNVSELLRTSDKKVSVVCDIQKSEKCLVKVIVRYYNALKNIDRNNGMYICRLRSMMKRCGRSNPNCKYKNLDDHLMDIINTEAKAYLLGWVASDGWLDENGIVGIGVDIRDVGVLEALRDFVCPDLPIIDHNKSMKRLRVFSAQWYKSIKEHLNLSFKKGESHKKSHLVQMPVDISDSLKWCFLRGYFEGDGSVFIAKSSKGWADCLSVNITSSSLAMRMMIVTFCKKFNINTCTYSMDVNIKLHGQYAARFLERIYARCNENFVLKRKYDTYKRLKIELSRFWNIAAAAEKVHLGNQMANLMIRCA